MNLLGIDYGRIYLGMAVAIDKYPQISKVVKSKSDHHKITEISNICIKEDINKIIIGYGSDSFKTDIDNFIELLKKTIKHEIVIVEESFTSNLAIEEMIKDQVPRNKRKLLEHAYAAKILLQNYLNSFI